MKPTKKQVRPLLDVRLNVFDWSFRFYIGAEGNKNNINTTDCEIEQQKKETEKDNKVSATSRKNNTTKPTKLSKEDTFNELSQLEADIDNLEKIDDGPLKDNLQSVDKQKDDSDEEDSEVLNKNQHIIMISKPTTASSHVLNSAEIIENEETTGIAVNDVANDISTVEEQEDIESISFTDVTDMETEEQQEDLEPISFTDVTDISTEEQQEDAEPIGFTDETDVEKPQDPTCNITVDFS